MQRILIESQEQFTALLQRAAREPRIAVDLESDGLFRYRPQLCTLQIGLPETCAVIDTLAIEDLSGLQTLLGPSGPLKIIHDLSFDARLLFRYDITLGNVFDTALAARLLGSAGTGLSALLAERCDVKLDKELQQYDWGKRPLTDDTLVYLYDDVLHLFRLHDSLATDVDAAGIGAELAVETHYTLDQATQDPSGTQKRAPWLRVKGAQTLPPEEQATLRALCALREDLAQRENVPPFRILHDRTLLQLAHSRPRSPAALRRGPSRLPRAAHPFIQDIVRAVEQGLRDRDAPQQDLATLPTAPSPTERALRRRLEKALSNWRREEAQRRQVDAQVVLSGHGLHALAQERPVDQPGLRRIRGLGDCRIERYGVDWLALIRSELEAG